MDPLDDDYDCFNCKYSDNFGNCTYSICKAQAEYYSDNKSNCSCSYCYCLNETEYGEICKDCRQGAHQG